MSVELSELGRTPISSASPAGEDCRSSDEYEALHNRIDASPAALAASEDGATDWEAVVTGAAQILETQSKDMMVAGYLAIGLMRSRGLEGLATGLQVYADLLESFWETAFPPPARERGRANAIAWLWEKSRVWLMSVSRQPQPPELIEPAVANVKRLGEFAAERLGDAAPAGDQEVARLLGALARAGTAPAVRGEAGSPVGEAPRGEAEAPVPEVGGLGSSVESAADVRKLIDRIRAALRTVARWHFEHEPTDAVGYRLRRQASWLAVAMAPMAEKGVTALPPPDVNVVDQVATLREQERWAELLLVAEEQQPQNSFWLDLSHASYEALRGLGKGHDDARTAVVAETAEVIRRVPELATLQFADGTPFASEATRAWLAEVAASGGVAGEPSAAPAKEREPEDYAAELPSACASRKDIAAVAVQAGKLLKRRQVGKAAALLSEKLHAAPAGRERFLWRMTLCELLSEGERAEGVLSHAERLVQEIDEYRLLEWEPDLAVEGLTVAYRLWRRRMDEDSAARASTALDRVALWDPAAALRLRRGR